MWIFYVFFVLCLLCVCVRLFICVLLCGHLLGKGLLAHVCGVLLWVCHFPIAILRQVWYLIVLIPDLCTLTYFKLLVMYHVYHVKIRTWYAATDNDIAIRQAYAQVCCLLYCSIDYNRVPTGFSHVIKRFSHVPCVSSQNTNKIHCHWRRYWNKPSIYAG